jgi:mannose-6-phosphate isomerase-like protein (cupin superfamily)
MVGEKEMNSKVELNKLLSDLEDYGRYFIGFVSTRGIQAGIIRLRPGGNDSQEAHSVDEVYYVIEGMGFPILDGKDHEVKQGTCIFVPAKAEHRFHGNKDDQVIFYALGGRS